MGEGSRGWDTFAGACSGLSGGADNLRTATALITNRRERYRFWWPAFVGWAHCWVLRQQACCCPLVGVGVLSLHLGGGVWCLFCG